MNENYICIDGKKYLLTEVKEKDNPFFTSKVPSSESYFYIDSQGYVTMSSAFSFTNTHFKIANYFKDEDVAKQLALEQTLRRLLIRYACSCEVKPHDFVYCVKYDITWKKYKVLAEYPSEIDLFQVYFNTRKDAENAIKEVIEPFMEEHPNFIWRYS